MGSVLQRWLILAVLLFCACERPGRAPADRKLEARPADSMAASAPGVEIWFTLTRPARSSTGASCVERGLEIRRAERRIPVPLLYTGESPTILNDSTMRAVLWTDCHPLTAYLVDLRTGQPVPEHEHRRRP
jgi:hypothetical protein